MGAEKKRQNHKQFFVLNVRLEDLNTVGGLRKHQILTQETSSKHNFVVDFFRRFTFEYWERIVLYEKEAPRPRIFFSKT